MARNKRKKGKGVIKLNFDGVESGGKSIPDGKYLAEIASGEQKEGEESGKAYIEWKFKIVGGKHKGGVVWDNTSLQPQALFRLRGLLECVAFEFPEDEEFEFDPSDVVGEQLMIEVVNEEYDGRDRPKVGSYGAAEDVDAEEEGEEEEEEEEDDKKSKKDKKKDKKKGKKDEEEEEEEIELPSEDEVNEMDEDELAELVEEHELEVDVEELSLKKARKAVIKALDALAEEAEEEEEEEEEEKPSKKGKKGKKSSESEFKKGDKVKFHDEDTDKTYKGKITALEDDSATVDVKGDEWTVDVSELEAV